MNEWLTEIWSAVKPFNDAAGLILAIWGATLSSALAVWEYRKRRLNLSTAYAFFGTDEIADEIIIVNLSPVPVFVSHWALVWIPKNHLSRKKPIDITPDDLNGFKIAGEDIVTLKFGGQDKIPWGYSVSEKRKLVLTLHIHGRKTVKKLTIKKS